MKSGILIFQDRFDVLLEKRPSGILTLEDAIETLLGIEIVDEYDEVEDMRMLALRLGKRRRSKMLGNLSSSIQNKNDSRTKANSEFSDE